MHKLRSYIPSANYLFTFEAAARRLSFTEAAEELNVSQPAVSKTIRALEETCGMQLFRREKPRLVLTPQGERLFAETQAAFDRLHETVTTLRTATSSDVVRVSFSSIFVALWLLPRLAKFKAQWPDIRLRIAESSQDSFDLEREDVDISSRLGYGNWPELHAWPFLLEEILPVCSPAYLAAHGPVTSPAELLNHPLLHFEERHRRRITWDAWMAAHGVQGQPVPHDVVFTDCLASTQAALLDQGVALGWTHLVNDHLKAGRLVNPLGTVLYTDKTLYLVAPKGRPVGPGTEIFRDWLLEEMRELPHLIP
ncbi:MAG: LysR family transcriptional regulator [Gemmobacter sp.]|jgi:LysR family glycine cleavage system transcriptional activator|nr:LysR family transcriptional regulator [Gemmobacter sp.]